jgi:hypothetical protein
MVLSELSNLWLQFLSMKPIKNLSPLWLTKRSFYINKPENPITFPTISTKSKKSNSANLSSPKPSKKQQT